MRGAAAMRTRHRSGAQHLKEQELLARAREHAGHSNSLTKGLIFCFMLGGSLVLNSWYLRPYFDNLKLQKAQDRAAKLAARAAAAQQASMTSESGGEEEEGETIYRTET
eukprot:TRINITY_DN22045_c0_g1_i1.p1 TRINITY_DN22045_c0_g1~~TRINITY_DN22045_c0_g1_i1.p1  ORF type:complete len:109 (-),score=13.95 TRINITY_DN22045_c0_g1_i1:54-380(-)